MPLRTKYREAIELLNQIGASDIKTWEEDGDLKLKATVKSDHDKKLVIDKIKELNFMQATDIEYNIKIE